MKRYAWKNKKTGNWLAVKEVKTGMFPRRIVEYTANLNEASVLAEHEIKDLKDFEQQFHWKKEAVIERFVHLVEEGIPQKRAPKRAGYLRRG